MNLVTFSFVVIFVLAFLLNYGFKKLRLESDRKARFNSLPIHYTYCFILWAVIFSSAILLSNFPAFVKNLLLALLFAGSFFATKVLFLKDFNSKKHVEKAGVFALSITAGIGILITVIITASILFEALRFFEMVSPFEFLFGTSWNPQMAITSDQEVGASSFGAIPVFTGTLLITLVAMLVAVPTGIMAAIYLSFYAHDKTRDYLKPVLEILAGVPTVVYGYFAVIAIAPLFKSVFASAGFNISSESALAAGFVMGIMIIPFILSLTDDALNSVSQTLKDGSLALGSTKSEMIKKVVLPSAMPSIVGAVILAVSRAIGETMIVVMAAGLVANLTFNPLESVTTATVQIVTLLVGDQEFNSPKTLAAFAIALTLFIFTFLFNIVALVVIKNYKKKYG
jgi:phosphate transport system permease protein